LLRARGLRRRRRDQARRRLAVARPARGRDDRGRGRAPDRLPRPPAARALSGARDARARRDHPARDHELAGAHRRPVRHPRLPELPGAAGRRARPPPGDVPGRRRGRGRLGCRHVPGLRAHARGPGLPGHPRGRGPRPDPRHRHDAVQAAGVRAELGLCGAGGRPLRLLRPAREPGGRLGGDDLAGDRHGGLRRPRHAVGPGARRAAALRPLRGLALRRRRVQPGRGGLRDHGRRHLLSARAGGLREIGMSYRLGVDVGGTFTDLVLVSPDGVARTCKVLSTTANYAEAIIAGIRELTAQAGIAARDIGEIIHGTTVATNAILERRGARAGLLTTEGFRDLLEIRERMNHRGEVVTPLDRDGAAAAIDRLLAEGVESIAVCFLHAYANPAHEAQVGAMIRERAPHVALTLSSEILPEMREFERTSTAVTNAYVMPVMGRYLASLEGELRALEARAPLLIMQSNGGVMTAEGGRQRPVHVIESGPAAGVIATAALARTIGAPNALSIDMGGTTAKASIIEGYEIKRTGEFEIGGTMSQGSRLNKGGGFLLRVPAIDIAEVGAG